MKFYPVGTGHRTERELWFDDKGRMWFEVKFGMMHDKSYAVSTYVWVSRQSPWGRQTERVCMKRHVISGGYGTPEMRAALVQLYTDLFIDEMTGLGFKVKNMRATEMKKWKTSESTTP